MIVTQELLDALKDYPKADRLVLGDTMKPMHDLSNAYYCEYSGVVIYFHPSILEQFINVA